MFVKSAWDLVTETANKWIDDKAPRMAAALAYYTIFAIAPLLVIVIGVAAILFGHDAAQGKIVEELGDLVGREGAQAVETILKNSQQNDASIFATIIGGIVLVIGATGVFVELQDALNTIWGVAPKPGRGIMGMLKDRFLSFTIILGVGFILMVSLVISAGLTALSDYIGSLLPNIDLAIALQVVNFVLSFIIFTVLLGMIYRILPDAEISWRDVGVGAAITAVLFTIGKYLIGLYLGQSSTSSTYGAAGSLAVLFVWVYYSSLILFFGAEFTVVYANRFGKRVVPSPNAILLSQRMCVQPDGTPVEDVDAIAEQRSERISQ